MTKRPHSRSQRDAGTASVLVLSVGLALLLLAIGLTGVAAAIGARHQAQSAADLAALAAAGRIGIADDACAAAQRIAAANRASIRICELALAADGRSGEVRVVVEHAAVLPALPGMVAVAEAMAARLPARG